jgi:acetate kinase
MDAILVVNAGSSSVKFQIFDIEGGAPRRLRKGQIDGIGTRPRLTAEANDKSSLIDRSYASDEISDVPAAIATVASWLRETQNFNPVAVGHRVVHGGPKYDRPVVIDQAVMANLEQYVSLAPLHQPNNLAPIRTLMLGIVFDPAANAGRKSLISRPESRIVLLVVPTDEELMIAQHTLAFLPKHTAKSGRAPWETYDKNTRQEEFP